MAIQRVPIRLIKIGRTYFFEDTEFSIKVTGLEGGLVQGLLKPPEIRTPVVVSPGQLRGEVDDVIEIACILEAVAAEFGVSEKELCGELKAARVARPRQVVMYLGHVFAGFSLPVVGGYLGQRDRTTVLHGVRKTIERAKDGPEFADRILSAWDAALSYQNCRSLAETRDEDEQSLAGHLGTRRGDLHPESNDLSVRRRSISKDTNGAGEIISFPPMCGEHPKAESKNLPLDEVNRELHSRGLGSTALIEKVEKIARDKDRQAEVSTPGAGRKP